MRTLVYCRPRNYPRAAEIAAERGKSVVVNGARFDRVHDLDRSAAAVVLVDDLPAIADAYRSLGVQVEEMTAVVLPDAPADLPAPKDSDGAADEGEPVDNKPKRRGRRAR
jgi:hypothetical protein